MPEFPVGLAQALADRYRLERPLGQGGMATVYLALDVKHGRQVALKVLRPELARTVGSARFLAEIRTTASLAHPHILPLYDSGVATLAPGTGSSGATEYLYYVMPLVEGETLRERLTREKRLPLDEALRLAAQAADALAYAHGRGIVHRDVKPENILLQAGHALVADFGIARAIDAAGGPRLTTIGLAIGTPLYMSPEQAAGDQDLDGRSDIYSLGCVLFEMITGEPPFAGSNLRSILARVLTESPPPLGPRDGQVPATVEQAVRRALARDPAERFATAAEFANALRARNDAAPAVPHKSLAVLPFVNLSPDPENEFFSDGMTDELINALAKLEGLHVVSRTSAFAFKGRQEDIRTIGERLNVQAVVEGSVRRAGRKLRVMAQLVNVRDGFHVWSETFDRELEDVFAIQDEIARAISSALEIRLLGRGPARPRHPADDLEAYSLYLKGRHHWNQRTDDALWTGLDFFRQALSRNPDYALAHAGVADSHLILGFYCVLPPNEAFPAAKAAALRALELDPGLAEARAALAYVAMYHDWDWDEAERGFRETLRLNPGYATAHQWYGNFLATQGRFEESIASFGRAISLDPLSPLRLAARGWGFYFARQYDEALDHGRRALALDPNFVVAHTWLGLALEQQGARQEAVAAFEEAVRLSGRTSHTLGMLGHARAVHGDHPAARAILAELEETRRIRFVSAYDLAVINVALGEVERALDWLELGFDERTHWMALLGVEPRFDPLRAVPRFHELLARLGMARPSVR
jgi:serine/threonine-protein kinase